MRLRELRIKKGLTQGELANIIDVDRTTYSKYEREDNVKISIEVLKRLADLYGVTLDYLCCLTDENLVSNKKSILDSSNDYSELLKNEEVMEMINEFMKLNKRQRTIIFARLYEMNDKNETSSELEPIIKKEKNA